MPPALPQVLLQRLKVLQKEQNKKAAKVYSKMFAAPKAKASKAAAAAENGAAPAAEGKENAEAAEVAA